MMAGNAVYYESGPPQMDIIVYCYSDAELLWKTLLLKIGYTKVTTSEHRRSFELCTRKIEYFTRPVWNFFITQKLY